MNAVMIGHAIWIDWVMIWSVHSAVIGSRDEFRDPGHKCSLYSTKYQKKLEPTRVIGKQWASRVHKHNFKTFSEVFRWKAEFVQLKQGLASLFDGVSGQCRHLHCSNAVLREFGRNLRMLTGLCVSQLGSVTITNHEFVVKIGKTICEAQNHVRKHLGTLIRHQNSYFNLLAHGSPFEVDDHAWISSRRAYCFNECVKPFLIMEVFSKTSYIYVAQAWLASAWAICGSVQ